MANMMEDMCELAQEREDGMCIADMIDLPQCSKCACPMIDGICIRKGCNRTLAGSDRDIRMSTLEQLVPPPVEGGVEDEEDESDPTFDPSNPGVNLSGWGYGAGDEDDDLMVGVAEAVAKRGVAQRAAGLRRVIKKRKVPRKTKGDGTRSGFEVLVKDGVRHTFVDKKSGKRCACLNGSIPMVDTTSEEDRESIVEAYMQKSRDASDIDGPGSYPAIKFATWALLAQAGVGLGGSHPSGKSKEQGTVHKYGRYVAEIGTKMGVTSFREMVDEDPEELKGRAEEAAKELGIKQANEQRQVKADSKTLAACTEAQKEARYVHYAGSKMAGWVAFAKAVVTQKEWLEDVFFEEEEEFGDTEEEYSEYEEGPAPASPAPPPPAAALPPASVAPPPVSSVEPQKWIKVQNGPWTARVIPGSSPSGYRFFNVPVDFDPVVTPIRSDAMAKFFGIPGTAAPVSVCMPATKPGSKKLVFKFRVSNDAMSEDSFVINDIMYKVIGAAGN